MSFTSFLGKEESIGGRCIHETEVTYIFVGGEKREGRQKKGRRGDKIFLLVRPLIQSPPAADWFMGQK
jgi:hypothetical protein